MTILLDANAREIPGFRLPAGSGVQTRLAVSSGLPPSAVLVFATIGLLFIGLVAVAGFTVLAQRRLRALGMLGAVGATDRHVRLVQRHRGRRRGQAGRRADEPESRHRQRRIGYRRPVRRAAVRRHESAAPALRHQARPGRADRRYPHPAHGPRRRAAQLRLQHAAAIRPCPRPAFRPSPARPRHSRPESPFAAPNSLITSYAVHALGLKTIPAGWLIQTV
jgi:hypothetical protein